MTSKKTNVVGVCVVCFVWFVWCCFPLLGGAAFLSLLRVLLSASSFFWVVKHTPHHKFFVFVRFLFLWVSNVLEGGFRFCFFLLCEILFYKKIKLKYVPTSSFFGAQDIHGKTNHGKEIHENTHETVNHETINHENTKITKHDITTTIFARHQTIRTTTRKHPENKKHANSNLAIQNLVSIFQFLNSQHFFLKKYVQVFGLTGGPNTPENMNI